MQLRQSIFTFGHQHRCFAAMDFGHVFKKAPIMLTYKSTLLFLDATTVALYDW